MNAHTNEESEIVLGERQADDCNDNNNMHFVNDFVKPLNDLYSFTNYDFRMYDISHVRKNEDKSSNTYGRRLLDTSKACELIF